MLLVLMSGLFGSDLLARLRQRKVVQWALAYLAAAWVVMQLVEVLGGRWAWPLWIQRLVDLLLVIGFAAVLVLAWYHGDRGRQRVTGPELVIIAALLGIAGLLVSIVRPSDATQRNSSADPPSLGSPSVDGSTRRVNRSSTAPSNRILRLDLVLPDSAPLSFVGVAPLGIGRQSLDVSPNGRFVVYASRRPGGTTRLCRRDLDKFEVFCLSGTDGALSPFISEDSRRIGFFANGALRIMPARGGDPSTLAEVPNPIGGTWLGGDSVIWAGSDGGELGIISTADGGGHGIKFRSMAKPGRAGGLLFRSTPEVLPDGVILYSNARNTYLIDRVDQTARLVLRNAESPRFLPPSSLLFTRGADLMIVEFDPELHQVRGEPRLIVENVRVESQGSAQFGVADDGTIILARGTHAAAGQLHWVDREGTPTPLPFRFETMTKFQVSPDGRQLAAGVLRASWDIWIFDLAAGNQRRLTREGNNARPAWSSDGKRIYYASNRDGVAKLLRQRADGSEEATVVDSGASSYNPEHVRPDGTLLSYDWMQNARPDLFLHHPDRAEEPRRVWSEPDASEALARFSPNGRWIAFSSDRLGRYEVFVAQANGAGRRFQVTSDGGEEPVWSPDGQGIYFRNGYDLLWLPLTISADRIAPAGPPVRMFHLSNWVNVPGHSYDVTPDGRRFVLALRDPNETAVRLQLIRGF